MTTNRVGACVFLGLLVLLSPQGRGDYVIPLNQGSIGGYTAYTEQGQARPVIRETDFSFLNDYEESFGDAFVASSNGEYFYMFGNTLGGYTPYPFTVAGRYNGLGHPAPDGSTLPPLGTNGELMFLLSNYAGVGTPPRDPIIRQNPYTGHDELFGYASHELLRGPFGFDPVIFRFDTVTGELLQYVAAGSGFDKLTTSSMTVAQDGSILFSTASGIYRQPAQLVLNPGGLNHEYAAEPRLTPGFDLLPPAIQADMLAAVEPTLLTDAANGDLGIASDGALIASSNGVLARFSPTSGAKLSDLPLPAGAVNVGPDGALYRLADTIQTAPNGDKMLDLIRYDSITGAELSRLPLDVTASANQIPLNFVASQRIYFLAAPEPTTLLLAGIAVVGASVLKTRRRRQSAR